MASDENKPKAHPSQASTFTNFEVVAVSKVGKSKNVVDAKHAAGTGAKPAANFMAPASNINGIESTNTTLVAPSDYEHIFTVNTKDKRATFKPGDTKFIDFSKSLSKNQKELAKMLTSKKSTSWTTTKVPKFTVLAPVQKFSEKRSPTTPPATCQVKGVNPLFAASTATTTLPHSSANSSASSVSMFSRESSSTNPSAVPSTAKIVETQKTATKMSSQKSTKTSPKTPPIQMLQERDKSKTPSSSKKPVTSPVTKATNKKSDSKSRSVGQRINLPATRRSKQTPTLAKGNKKPSSDNLADKVRAVLPHSNVKKRSKSKLHLNDKKTDNNDIGRPVIIKTVSTNQNQVHDNTPSLHKSQFVERSKSESSTSPEKQQTVFRTQYTQTVKPSHLHGSPETASESHHSTSPATGMSAGYTPATNTSSTMQNTPGAYFTPQYGPMTGPVSGQQAGFFGQQPAPPMAYYQPTAANNKKPGFCCCC